MLFSVFLILKKSGVLNFQDLLNYLFLSWFIFPRHGVTSSNKFSKKKLYDIGKFQPTAVRDVGETNS